MPGQALGQLHVQSQRAQSAYAMWKVRHPSIFGQVAYIRDLLKGRKPDTFGGWTISVDGCFASLSLVEGSPAHILAKQETKLFQWPGQRNANRRLRTLAAILALVKVGEDQTRLDLEELKYPD